MVIQRSKRNRLMQLSPEGLPHIILPARSSSSFLLQGALTWRSPGEERAQELPSTSLPPREGTALLCPCAICVSASCLATSKAQTVLSLTFPPGVCAAPSAAPEPSRRGGVCRAVVQTQSRAGLSSRATTFQTPPRDVHGFQEPC